MDRQAPGTSSGQEPGRQDGAAPKPSYYVRNRWRPWVSGAFAGTSIILTVTTVCYALGMLPLPLVAISVLLAVAVFAFGLYARVRAARFDEGIT